MVELRPAMHYAPGKVSTLLTSRLMPLRGSISLTGKIDAYGAFPA